MFTENDQMQFKKMGIKPEVVEKQIDDFKTGFPFMDIKKAATVGEGIIKFSPEQEDFYLQKFENTKESLSMLKLVPASGAASRMFKELFSFLAELKGNDNDIELLKNSKGFNSAGNFFESIEMFAFYDDLQKLLPDLQQWKGNWHAAALKKVLENLLTETGLNYGNLPKGLLKFHKYPSGSRTSFEEHLVEGAQYSVAGNRVQIHFTVSPEHRLAFEKHLKEVKHIYEDKFKVKFEISFSVQKTATDTVAVDLENKPFRNNDNSILFRPGGHGALIENLNDLDADLVFIKNIDNVVPDSLKEPTSKYKKILAGVVIHYQQLISIYLKQLESSEVTEDFVSEILNFLEREMCIIHPENINSLSLIEKSNYLRKKLHRPIRICGMVKNEGEPGGGPFWARNNDNSIALQVVESSQIDAKSIEKQEIVKNATHFNPVDLICYLKDHNGHKFNLLHFIDHNTGFISQKSKDGRELKALELPGLWNGAMSDWNTLFVEVPIETFNPVKTVNDLLRPQHQ